MSRNKTSNWVLVGAVVVTGLLVLSLVGHRNMSIKATVLLVVGSCTLTGVSVKVYEENIKKAKRLKASVETLQPKDTVPSASSSIGEQRHAYDASDLPPDPPKDTAPSASSSIGEQRHAYDASDLPPGPRLPLGQLKPPVHDRDRWWYNTTDDRPSLPQDTQPSANSSIEDLIHSLEHCGNNQEFRRLAAEYLGQMGSAAVPAISSLLIACVDDIEMVRIAASNALGFIDPDWPQNPEVNKALPKLTEKFKHSYCFKKAYSVEVSKAAYKLLQQIGQPAVPFLANLIVEEEEKIEYKIRAIWILRDLGPTATGAMPQLIQALSDKTIRVRVAAAEALETFNVAAKVATPQLIDGFADRDIDVRNAMVACLVATKPVIPDLLPLLIDQNPNVRKSVADALVKIGPQALQFLVETVSQGCTQLKADIDDHRNHPKITEAALQVLGRFGSGASVAMPTIALALVESNPGIKLAAIQAMGSIDRSWTSNPVVFDTLASLASVEKNVISKLVIGLDSQDSEVHKAMAACLAQFGATAKPAVPYLLRLSTNWNVGVREAAIDALGQIGAGAKAAIPDLNKASQDKNPLIQRAAIIALQKINASKIDDE